MLLIVRLATFCLLIPMLVNQLGNIWVHKGTNGLSNTRKALFWITAGYFIDIVFVSLADLHLFITGVSKWNYFRKVEYTLLFGRIIMLVGIYKFYKLFHVKKK